MITTSAISPSWKLPFWRASDMNGKPVAKMIERLLPDFAWQTAFEVLTMMETHILNEAEKTGEPEHDISQNSVSVSLKSLVEHGVVERKMVRIKQAIERRGKKEVFHYCIANTVNSAVVAPKRIPKSHLRVFDVLSKLQSEMRPYPRATPQSFLHPC